MIGGDCLTFLFMLVTAAGCARDVQVSPSDCFQTVRTPSCVRITDALKQLSSNTTLHLLPGEHMLEEFALVQRVSNIALIGETHESNISIICREGLGLAFVGVRNLTIQYITVQRCGLSGGNLEKVMDAVEKRIDAFFKVPHSLDIAFLLADITDACIKHITVQNTTGIGLLGINLVGTSSLINSTFSHNVNEKCSVPQLLYEILNVDNARQIGGGAFLVYYDYNNTFNVEDNRMELKIQDSTFLENKDCSVSGSIAQRMQFSTALRRRGYTVGGGGGLSVVLSQKSYSTSISVISCSFVKNLAQFGAGLYLAIFSSIGASSVVLSDSQFIENGGVDLTNGGGLTMLGDLVRPFGYNNTGSTLSSFTLDIVDSSFVNNRAFLGGGVYILLVSGSLDKFSSGHNATTLTFCDCTFQANIAKFGAALYIHEYNVVSAEVYDKPLGSLVELSNFRAESNTLLDPIRRSANHSGIIDIRYTHFTLRGNCAFIHNSGTAIRARRSPINVYNHAVFHGNVGTFGGAMALVAFSYLIIHPNTSVAFTNNRATVNGGVFHVDVPDQPVYVLFDCFLYLNSPDAFYCYDSTTCLTKSISELGISVTFINNSAPLGSFVYGSALQSCPWGNVLRTGDSNNALNFWLYLAQNEQTNKIFDFDRYPEGIGQVTTPSYKLNGEMDLSRSVMPGQIFELKMRAEDRLEQQIPIAVTSTVISNPSPEEHYFIDNPDVAPSSTLGYSNYWGLAKQNDTTVQMRVMGRIGDNVNVSIFTTDSAEETNVQVYLLDCYPGFTLEDTSCVCIPELRNEGIECSDDTHELTIPDSVWLGPVSKTNNQSLAVAQCVLDYCKRGRKVIRVQSVKSFDEQCADGYNRTGFLCSLCREGNSVVLGTTKCRVCSSNAFLALILVFVAAGVLLIALVAFLKVSVSEGYINGLLFYSHIVSPYIFRMAPEAPAIFLPVSFLSLALGIETCFYNGMTALQYTGLQFVFPFYLYFLMGAIVICARFIKWPYNIGFSAGKTFATLLTVSYASILRTCIVILGNITVRFITRPEGGSSVCWYVDPTIHYFSGLHAVFVCISLLLLILYIIPLPIVLLFPSRAYQFKYTRKMKPILDAFFSPYKPKFRCWIGVRFLFSVCILAVGLFLQYSQTALMLIIIALVIFVYIQLLIMPYNGFCRNASDSFLLINIIILLLGIVFHSERYLLYDNTNKVEQVQTIYSAVVVALAYVVFIAVLLYHIYLRLPHSKQMKIMESLKCIKKALESCKKDGSGQAPSCEEVRVERYYRFEDPEADIERHDTESSIVDGQGKMKKHATSSIVEVPDDSDQGDENESMTSNFANIHNGTGTEI